MQKANEAISKNSKKTADFYLARYLGLSVAKNAPPRDLRDLQELLKKRKLAPKAFVPGEWDPDFIDWFEKGLYARWGVPETRIREKARSFEICSAGYMDKYFVTIVAYPEMELWHVLENGLGTRPLYMAMGSVSDRPTVFFGKTFKNKASFQSKPLYLDTKKRSLHYVWKPDFFDVDLDGMPEVWLRYDLAWGNGFAQVLECYRIQNEGELVLLKRFQADPDGVARRLSDGRVEVGTTVKERTHFEIWEYKDRSFKKSSEEDKPSILKTAAWRDYYLERTI